jgi:hypothetical protein
MVHSWRLDHRLQSQTDWPKIPRSRVVKSLFPACVIAEFPEIPLDRPEPGRLKFHLLEDRKLVYMLSPKYFLNVRRKMFGITKFQSPSDSRPKVLFAHLIHGPVHS